MVSVGLCCCNAEAGSVYTSLNISFSQCSSNTSEHQCKSVGVLPSLLGKLHGNISLQVKETGYKTLDIALHLLYFYFGQDELELFH